MNHLKERQKKKKEDKIHKVENEKKRNFHWVIASLAS
jgi:hypothetical protein